MNVEEKKLKHYAEKSFKEIANFEAAYNLSIWYYKTNQL